MGDEEIFHLTAFQRDILYVVATEPKQSGREIKDTFAESASADVNLKNGRLYPNLNQLVDIGYVKQGEVNRRTNWYRITQEGMDALIKRRHWEDKLVEFLSEQPENISFLIQKMQRNRDGYSPRQ